MEESKCYTIPHDLALARSISGLHHAQVIMSWDTILGNSTKPAEKVAIRYNGNKYEADPQAVIDALVGSGLFKLVEGSE